MLCSRVRNLLSAYCDRELTGDEALRIRHHLAGCPECREEHAALCRVKLLLGSLDSVAPPQPFSLAAVEGRRPRSWLDRAWSLHSEELRQWAQRAGLMTPLSRASTGQLALVGTLAVAVVALGILQQPQPPDAVIAHVPSFLSPDAMPVSAGEPQLVGLSPVTATAAYPYYLRPSFAAYDLYRDRPFHPDDFRALEPPALRTVEFSQPVRGPGR